MLIEKGYKKVLANSGSVIHIPKSTDHRVHILPEKYGAFLTYPLDSDELYRSLPRPLFYGKQPIQINEMEGSSLKTLYYTAGNHIQLLDLTSKELHLGNHMGAFVFPTVPAIVELNGETIELEPYSTFYVAHHPFKVKRQEEGPIYALKKVDRTGGSPY